MGRRTNKTKKIRRRFIEAQRGRCVLCGGPLVQPTLEHLTPRSKGGNSSPSNLAVSCAKCNHARGTKPLTAEQRSRLVAPSRRRGGVTTAAFGPGRWWLPRELPFQALDLIDDLIEDQKPLHYLHGIREVSFVGERQFDVRCRCGDLLHVFQFALC